MCALTIWFKHNEISGLLGSPRESGQLTGRRGHLDGAPPGVRSAEYTITVWSSEVAVRLHINTAVSLNRSVPFMSGM
jgi:hypothetical protein